MALPINAQKPPASGILQKLPRLSTPTWLIVIAALVLVAAVPLVTTYLDETAKQQPLRERLAKLQSQNTDLQKQLSSQGSLTTQINALKAEVEVARGRYGNACDSVEASRDLIDLAWQYDITIVNMMSAPVVSKIDGKDYSGTSYVLTVSGQVSNFQNYLIALGNKFASSRPADILITPAAQEGTLDHAALTITVICNQ